MLAIGLMIGMVNVIKMQFPQVKGLYAFLLSLICGVFLGVVHWYGVVSIEQGVLLAFVASGVYKVVSKAGGK